MQDLLSVGEGFAELDLVVRQLDDGTLTLSTDDATPDEARVRVVAGELGLEAIVELAAAPELTADLGRALDHMNRDAELVRFVWRERRVECQASLPWGDRSFAPNQLHVLYGAVADAREQYALPLSTVIRGQATWSSICDSAELLPASYLAGVGQGDSDGLTGRYGGLSEVPGRAELSKTERYAKSAPARGGGGLVAVFGLLLLAGVGGGIYFVTRKKTNDVSVASPAPSSPVPSETPEADPTEADDPADVEGGSADPDTGSSDGGGDAGASPTPVATSVSLRDLDEDGVLRTLRAEPDRRVELVERWYQGGYDRSEGARRRMLEALGGSGDYDPDVGRVLLKSLREHPVDIYEAMDCFPAARSGLRRQLIKTLSQARGAEAKDAADFLADHRAEDSEDLIIEEAILALGYGSASSFVKVTEARGVEWATLGGGRQLLETMASRDLKQLHPILSQGDEQLRVLILDLIKATEGQADTALRLYVGCLTDPAPAVRQRAVQGCVALRNPKVSWALARALVREQDDQTLDALRDAFTRLPGDETVDLLQRLYRKQEPIERLAAVRGLEATQSAVGVPPLLVALGDADREVKKAVLHALANHYKRKPELRPAVLEGLGRIREIALDRSDTDLSRLAKNLHFKISGKMPR